MMVSNQTWYDEARVGLFIHWGINTGNENWQQRIPKYKTPEEFEDAALAAGWSAEKFVGAAQRLHASYITLAVFHGALGYIKAWKSDIPGTYTTRNDFLQELIDEAGKHDIKILLYLGGDSTGHVFYPEHPWIDPEAYKKYKNDDSINILDFGVWQRVYVKEIIGELIDNYPDLAGFWFDGWNRDDVNEEVFNFVHEKNPGLINIKNNFTAQKSVGEDIMSIECFGKVLEPSFDFVSGCWVPPHGQECCYVMSELSDWWQYYEPGAYDKNELLRKLITITTNGWVAKVGLGPNIAGDFNGTLGGFISDVDDYLSWAQESIFGTTAGGLTIGYQNDGAYVTSCRKGNDYYLHTLLPPKGDILMIPDGGMTFAGAVNLKTGGEVALNQEDGVLHIKAEFNQFCEMDGDMIIKLKAEKSNIVQTAEVKEYLSELPAEIVIDNPAEINGILIHEDESASVTNGGWAAPENNRARDYILSVSEDGIHFTTISQGRLSGQRGDKQINFSATAAPYMKLRIENAYNTTEGYVKKFVGVTWSYLDKDDTLVPAKEQVIGKNKYICDENGNVSGWADNGNNVYLIACNAKGIAVSDDGALLAIMPKEKGKLRIRRVSLIQSKG